MIHLAKNLNPKRATKVERSRPILYLICAILLAVVVFWIERPDRAQVKGANDQLLLPQITESQVTKIEIEHLLNGVIISRNESAKWNVEQYETKMAEQVRKQEADSAEKIPQFTSFPADPKRIEDMLTDLKELRVGAVASRKPESHSKLQVSGAGLSVKFLDADGEVLEDLTVGKQGPDFLSTYVRRANEDEVYLVSEQLHGRFPTNVNEWRDRTLWNIDLGEIQKVEVDRLSGGFILIKQADGKFKANHSVKIDNDKLRSWLTSWNELKAETIADNVDTSDAGLKNAKSKLIVTLKDESVQTLLIGKDSPSGTPYGQLENQQTVYILPSNIQTALKVELSELVAEKPSKANN